MFAVGEDSVVQAGSTHLEAIGVRNRFVQLTAPQESACDQICVCVPINVLRLLVQPSLLHQIRVERGVKMEDHATEIDVFVLLDFKDPTVEFLYAAEAVRMEDSALVQKTADVLLVLAVHDAKQTLDWDHVLLKSLIRSARVN